jgi:hypothetical protein
VALLVSILEIALIIALSILLLALLFYPGELTWRLRPWFIEGSPKRGYCVAFVALILASAVIHAAN